VRKSLEKSSEIVLNFYLKQNPLNTSSKQNIRDNIYLRYQIRARFRNDYVIMLMVINTFTPDKVGLRHCQQHL